LTCFTLHVHNCGPSHTNQPAHRAHHAQQGRKPTTGSLERARARLVALPGQAALEQEEQRVRQALQVVAAAGGAAQVRVHARIPHRAPARARPPEGALGQKEWLQCESKGAQTAPAILSRSVRWLAAQPRRARRAGSGRQCKRTRTVGYDGWRYAPGGAESLVNSESETWEVWGTGGGAHRKTSGRWSYSTCVPQTESRHRVAARAARPAESISYHRSHG